MKMDISRQFPIIGTEWLLKKNVKYAKQKVKRLKKLLKEVDKGRAIVYRPLEGRAYFMLERDRLQNEIKNYENVRIPMLEKRLKNIKKVV